MEVNQTLDEVKKPTIAAVHGTPLGGGLETDHGCHFRVAAAARGSACRRSSSASFPERRHAALPRLVGIEKRARR